MELAYGFVLYVVAPLILVVSVGYLFVGVGRVPFGGVPGEPPYAAVRRAAITGAAAGLVLAAMYVVLAATGESGLVVRTVEVTGLSGFDGLVGGVAGAVLLVAFYDRPSRGRRVGAVCLVLSAIAGASLFNLYLSPPLQSFTVMFVLGSSFGVLAGRLLRPAVDEASEPGDVDGAPDPHTDG